MQNNVGGKKGITTNNSYTEKVVTSYHSQLCTNILEKIGKMDEFTEKLNSTEKIRKTLKRLKFLVAIDLYLKFYLQRKRLGLNGFTDA